MKISPEDVVRAGGGEVLRRGRVRVIRRFSVDSRTLRPGDLFFAIRGERHDGHDYISQALQKGACGAVGAEDRLKRDSPGGEGWLMAVSDPLAVLGDSARVWRDRFSCPMIGVTGSNGKTTCKDMMAAVLSARFKVHRTEGNFNNWVGVPLTLAAMDLTDEIGVIEMGMNHPGEITRLCEIARPTAGVITNVGRAHLGGFPSQKEIALAKGELVESLPPKAPVVLNADDPWTDLLSARSKGPVTLFGFGPRSHVRATEIVSESAEGCRFRGKVFESSFEIKLPLPGRHNVSNALAALAVGHLFDVDLSRSIGALSQFKGAPLRSELVRLSEDRLLLADCYNANPDSMAVALETARNIAQGRPIIAVLGDMMELGASAGALHQEVGRKAGEAGVRSLVAVGRWGPVVAEGFLRGAAGGETAVVGTAEEAARRAVTLARPSHLVVVKGSHSVGLEVVVAALKGRFQP